MSCRVQQGIMRELIKRELHPIPYTHPFIVRHLLDAFIYMDSIRTRTNRRPKSTHVQEQRGEPKIK